MAEPPITRTTLLDAIAVQEKDLIFMDRSLWQRKFEHLKAGTRNEWELVGTDVWFYSYTTEFSRPIMTHEVVLQGDMMTSVSDPLPYPSNVRFRPHRRPLYHGSFKDWLKRVGNLTTWMLDHRIVDNTRVRPAGEKGKGHDGSFTRVDAIPDLGVEASYAVTFSNSSKLLRTSTGYVPPLIVADEQEVWQVSPRMLSTEPPSRNVL